MGVCVVVFVACAPPRVWVVFRTPAKWSVFIVRKGKAHTHVGTHPHPRVCWSVSLSASLQHFLYGDKKKDEKPSTSVVDNAG